MQALSFDDVTIQKLFGHEAAEDEDPTRLREYYFRSSVFDRATADLPLRILVGHKGLGKSALFQVARQQDAEQHTLAILLRPDDVHEVSSDGDILTATRNWKSGLLRIIYSKCIERLGSAPNNEDDPGWLRSAIPLVDKLVEALRPTLDKALDVEKAQRRLAESLIKNKIIRVYVDDLDRGWTATPKSIARLSSLLNAARDLVKEHPGLQFRISMRTDVYFLVRTSDESTDKIEGSVVWYSWTNHEILALLVKRVQSFFGNQMPEDKLVHMDQSALSGLLDPVMEPRFFGHGKWSSIPTYRMLMSLVRRRPRDLVKLLTLAAQAAARRNGICKIGTDDFKSVFEQYSQGRLQDTINEYRSELPDIEALLLSMRPTRQRKNGGRPYTFSTAELLKKLRDIMSMQATFKFYPSKPSTEKDLAAFLYKINFLTGRKEIDGRIVRQFFEENKYLSSSFVEFGFDWEIHPAYRWALQPGEVTQIISNLDDVAD